MKLADRVHRGYVHPRRVRVLCDHLSALIPAGASVLDVGCGDGRLAEAILERRPDVGIRGVDVQVRDGARVPVDPFDGRTLPAPDRSFDAVMLVDVVHHADDPMRLLEEGVRVSRGALLLKDHTLEGFAAGATLRLMDRVGNARHGVALPYHYWPRRRWLEAFEALGLEVAEWIDKPRLYPSPASWVFGRSLHFIARLARTPA